MDVLVEWVDGASNTSNSQSQADDDIPLAQLKTLIMDKNQPLLMLESDVVSETAVEEAGGRGFQEMEENHVRETTTTNPPTSDHADFDDSDHDSTRIRECEFAACTKEIFSTCHKCMCFLCWDHFVMENDMCISQHKTKKRVRNVQQNVNNNTQIRVLPENFIVDGAEKEGDNVMEVLQKRENKKKNAQERRNRGKEYISLTKNKHCQAKTVGPRCRESSSCRKLGKQCTLLTEDERQIIMADFYATGSLQLQREYIVRHVKTENIKHKTTKQETSRRLKSNIYYLPKEGKNISVCKIMFLNTLSISEKTMRTSLAKVQNSGVIETEKRGGRQSHLQAKDVKIREVIVAHISKFPRMESHYCRRSSTREYLHSDLSISKMHYMFLNENSTLRVSYSTYANVFNSFKLSFHHPKKDQCGICANYRKGDAERRRALEDCYQKHTAEKVAVRAKKDLARKDKNIKNASAVFDLQQVIFLPISNESKIFYRRRLSNYNFTIYNLKSKECHCYTWHEALSKRGSCEISTCLYFYLKELDARGVETVSLFSDSCSGQNKNSIIAAMLLYIVSLFKNIETISVSYFEPYHGQNEGDSAHSAIARAVGKAEEVFVPSQLVPIFKLARRNNPYIVHSLNSGEFLNFKQLSRDLRILSVRKDDKGSGVDWTRMREVMVTKKHTTKIFFKDSHLLKEYRSITLQNRQRVSPSNRPLCLNHTPPKISLAKFNDLMSLCQGMTPVIRLQEYIDFYKSLPH